MMLYREIRSCRICENQDLDSILELGNMALTGVFPKTAEEEVQYLSDFMNQYQDEADRLTRKIS